jgi:hypothetical protein
MEWKELPLEKEDMQLHQRVIKEVSVSFANICRIVESELGTKKTDESISTVAKIYLSALCNYYDAALNAVSDTG